MATVRILRQGGEFRSPAFQDYTVQPPPGQTVLECLFEILEKQDGSLAFRYACRGAVCGSCAMHINGKYRLACSTQMRDMGEVVEIRPLAHFPVIRDLVVDMTEFFEKYEALRPYLINETAPPEGKERLQSPKERERLDELIDCILCTSCHASCPMTLTDPEYLGPALLMKVDRFASDSRDEALDERLESVNSEHGVFRCHTILNCVEVCPKTLHPTHSIAKLKQRLVKRHLFGGK